MSDPLRVAYEQSLATTRALAVLMRERAVDRIMSAIKATPCCDVHPDFEAQTHCCYVPPEEVDHIERCGE